MAGLPFQNGVLAQTVNVSYLASQVMTTGLASYVELDSVLGLEDVLNILEVFQVSEHNKMLVNKYGNEYS